MNHPWFNKYPIKGSGFAANIKQIKLVVL